MELYLIVLIAGMLMVSGVVVYYIYFDEGQVYFMPKIDQVIPKTTTP